MGHTERLSTPNPQPGNTLPLGASAVTSQQLKKQNIAAPRCTTGSAAVDERVIKGQSREGQLGERAKFRNLSDFMPPSIYRHVLTGLMWLGSLP